MDKGLGKAKVPHDIITYRWVDEKAFSFPDSLRNEDGTINIVKAKEFENQFKGKIIKEDSFVSTSLVEIPNKKFSPEKYPVQLRITLPRVEVAAYISYFSAFPFEVEILIRRGLQLKYKNINIVNKKGKEILVVDVSVVS